MPWLEEVYERTLEEFSGKSSERCLVLFSYFPAVPEQDSALILKHVEGKWERNVGKRRYEDVLYEIDNPLQPLRSVGSCRREKGTCRPCMFFTSRIGCRAGRTCVSCHQTPNPKMIAEARVQKQMAFLNEDISD